MVAVLPDSEAELTVTSPPPRRWEQGVISGLLTNPVYERRFGEPDPTSPSGYSLPSTRRSLITAFMSLGALFGALLIGQLVRRTGVKVAIMFSLFIYSVGVAIETSGQTQYGQEIAGRFITGFGVGSLSLLAPLYQAECSPKHLRGLITSTFQLAATLGIFLANAVNYAQHAKGTDFSWRFPIAIQLIWAAIVFVGTVLAPESPRYYVQRNNLDRARVNLAKLRGLDEEDPELLAELDTIVRGVEDEKLAADSTYLDCFRMKDRMFLRTMNGVMAQWGQQWSGVKCVAFPGLPRRRPSSSLTFSLPSLPFLLSILSFSFFFSYGNNFFATSGIKDPYQTQLILSGVNVLATFPGILAVDRIGRRALLFIGSAMMFSGQIIAGAVSTAKPNDPAAGKALIFASCFFIAGFASSWGPLGCVVPLPQQMLQMRSTGIVGPDER